MASPPYPAHLDILRTEFKGAHAPDTPLGIVTDLDVLHHHVAIRSIIPLGIHAPSPVAEHLGIGKSDAPCQDTRVCIVVDSTEVALWVPECNITLSIDSKSLVVLDLHNTLKQGAIQDTAIAFKKLDAIPIVVRHLESRSSRTNDHAFDQNATSLTASPLPVVVHLHVSSKSKIAVNVRSSRGLDAPAAVIVHFGVDNSPSVSGIDSAASIRVNSTGVRFGALEHYSSKGVYPKPFVIFDLDASKIPHSRIRDIVVLCRRTDSV